ncbi:MAG: methyltransferase, partial [Nannocystis sp.]
MLRALIWPVTVLLAACGSPTASPQPAAQASPKAAAAPAHDEHAGHGPLAAHDLHAQEHEIAGELAQPVEDHRARNHHRHHRFDDAEKWAPQFDSADREAWQKPDAVIAALALAPGARVADLGAGTGYFAVRLARAVPQGCVFAQDLEPDMIRYLGERAKREGLANLVAVQGEPNDPRLPEAVDLAIMVDTYHHVADPTGFFARVRDHLVPGGRLVIVDFKKDAPDDAPGPP